MHTTGLKTCCFAICYGDLLQVRYKHATGPAQVFTRNVMASDSKRGQSRKKVRERSVAPEQRSLPLQNFTLEDITNDLCQNVPDFLNVRDEQLSLALLDGMERCMLDDMVSWFLHGEGLDADEKQMWGVPKWNYTEGDPFDSFDYYAVSGCNTKRTLWLCGVSHLVLFFQAPIAVQRTN